MAGLTDGMDRPPNLSLEIILAARFEEAPSRKTSSMSLIRRRPQSQLPFQAAVFALRALTAEPSKFGESSAGGRMAAAISSANCS
jgi:hypothetical protein